MEGHATISTDVVARYAADAALDVDGVRSLPRHRAVRIDGDGDAKRLELHVVVDWGASIPRLGRDVQARVREYVERMTDMRVESVEVIVDEIAAP